MLFNSVMVIEADFIPIQVNGRKIVKVANKTGINESRISALDFQKA